MRLECCAGCRSKGVTVPSNAPAPATPPAPQGRISAAQASGARRYHLVLLALSAVLLIVFVGSFSLGRYGMPPQTVVEILASKVPFLHIPVDWTPAMETVVLQVRLPRIIGAVVVGSALASAGVAYQSMFRNPLVSPAILGVSAGAGFGAALGILLGVSWALIQLLGFGFGLLATAAAVLISRLVGRGSIVVLVLGGVVVSAVFQALISVLQYIADPLDSLPAITFWLMGGLGRIGVDDLLPAIGIVLACFAVLMVLRWQINVMGLGSEDAAALGINQRRVMAISIVAATVMTAAVVSIAGIVGWVGLIVPHMARILVGPNAHRLLPVSALLGGLFLLLVDNVARVLTQTELPLGILTALIGAPLFVVLLGRTRKQWV